MASKIEVFPLKIYSKHQRYLYALPVFDGNMQAIEVLRTTLRLTPTNAFVYLALGCLFNDLLEYGEAMVAAFAFALPQLGALEFVYSYLFILHRGGVGVRMRYSLLLKLCHTILIQ